MLFLQSARLQVLLYHVSQRFFCRPRLRRPLTSAVMIQFVQLWSSLLIKNCMKTAWACGEIISFRMAKEGMRHHYNDPDCGADGLHQPTQRRQSGLKTRGRGSGSQNCRV